MSRWSPITCLPLQTLTPSGLINLDALDGEVQLLSRSSVELRSLSSSPLPKPPRLSKSGSGSASASASSQQWIDRDTNLTVTITTHRTVFQSKSGSKDAQAQAQAHFLHHCAIKTHEESGGEWLSNRSYKIQIDSVSHGSLHLIFREGKSDRDAFSDALKKALTRKQWEETYRIQQSGSGSGSGIGSGIARKVGVDAILQRNKNKHDRAKELTNDAFGDAKKRKGKDERAKEVENLFREAKELTTIIHKYTTTLEKNKKEGGGYGDTDDDDDDTTELSSMMANMGMITALTKDASSSYHETLARQIADFLAGNKKFMTSKGGSGIMSLTDLYCLFNRARGVNMISPDDLIESLELMKTLGLPFKLREFDESGVRCVIESTFDDSVMAKKILDFIQGKEEGASSSGEGAMQSFRRFIAGSASEDDNFHMSHKYYGLTVLEAARFLNIPPILANEQLLSAERNGHLCRDVTLEGTRFYRNHFLSSF